jgi:tyrosinase
LGALLVAPRGGRSVAAQVDPIAAGPDGRPERRNIVGLAPDGPEIAAYKRGVARMKDWNELDPTDPMFRLSWIYQASIHGRALPPGQDLGGPDGVWNTCQHFSWFFLPWHRLFLYWFERIVRKACDDSNFALPYWDWSIADGQRLPEVFRVPADDTNPLYVSDREPTMNEGDAFVSNLRRSVHPDWWRNEPRFFHELDDARPISFGGVPKFTEEPFSGEGGGRVESPGHGSVHTSVGGFVDDATFLPPFRPGLMTDPATAALDPIFWLHHTNIDRIWNRWIDPGTGRVNPTDARWTGQTFRFVDENGVIVTKSVQDVLDLEASGQFGYRYDDDPLLIPVTPVVEPETTPVFIDGEEPKRAVAGRAERHLELGPEPVVVSVTLEDAAAVDRAASGTPAAGIGDPIVVLTIEGIRGEGDPGVAVEVYLNVPAGEEPDAADDRFVGEISLFALQPREESGDHAVHSITQSFDITAAVDGLRERGEWQGGIEVTLVARSLVSRPAGEATPGAVSAGTPEPPQGPWASIEAVTVSTD